MSFTSQLLVNVFESHERVDCDLRALHKHGFDMMKLSIVGRAHHTEDSASGYYNDGKCLAYWGRSGALWGGYWELLCGSAYFWIPRIGPILVGGPLVGWIIFALEGAVQASGFTMLGGALLSVGAAINRISEYEAEVRNGKLLLVINGTVRDLEQANDLLNQGQTFGPDLHAKTPQPAY